MRNTTTTTTSGRCPAGSVARANRLKESANRRALRIKHGIDPDVPLVVNVGAVTERKGQHIFVRAIDLLMKENFANSPWQPRPRFLIIGARDGIYLESVEQDIALLGLDSVGIVRETADVEDYFLMADILVCSSFEESFPRVLLEAMALGVRIVSTNVFGIPEMLTGNDEAHLVPAGDAHKLAGAMKTALADHREGNEKMVSMAYARVSRHFSANRLLPLHQRLCRKALAWVNRAHD